MHRYRPTRTLATATARPQVGRGQRPSFESRRHRGLWQPQGIADRDHQRRRQTPMPASLRFLERDVARTDRARDGCLLEASFGCEALARALHRMSYTKPSKTDSRDQDALARDVR
jgi:hypothetical protein